MSTSLQTPPALDGVRHDWVDAGGLRTHVALAGPEDAPPLLLVHGWPQHWWAWRKVIPELARSYRVICPDLRGHGWTDAPAGGYEKEQMATDLLAAPRRAGIERATWAGHDWGAFSGTLAALRAPERFERLVAMCVPPPFARDRSPRTALVCSATRSRSAPRCSAPSSRATASPARSSGRTRQGSWTDEEIRTYDDVFRARPHVSVAAYRTLLTTRGAPLCAGATRGRTRRCRPPCCVGDRDLVTKGIAAGPFPGQPTMTVQRIPGVGHFLPEEDPEAVIAALRPS